MNLFILFLMLFNTGGMFGPLKHKNSKFTFSRDREIEINLVNNEEK